ncbi:hypothetical protein DCPSUM001_33680 [Dysgonomonas capnocytophagoides]|nr:hypothetical protein DCPSUM001_33680 [Dysgonomonas capnocytophagoides]
MNVIFALLIVVIAFQLCVFIRGFYLKILKIGQAEFLITIALVLEILAVIKIYTTL